MKKSFMTRVLATGLSLAMAFSLTAATNVTTAEAATSLMRTTTKTLTEGQTRMTLMKKSYESKYRIKNTTRDADAKKIINVAKVRANKKGIDITAKKTAVTDAGLEQAKGVVTVNFVKKADANKKNAKVVKSSKLTVVVKAKPAEKPAVATITEAVQKETKKVAVTFSTAVESVKTADFSVVRVDGNVVAPIKGVVLGDDKKSATIETFVDMKDEKEYKVTYTAADEAKTSSSATFIASNGKVGKLDFNKSTVVAGESTEVKVCTYDANGVKLGEYKFSELAAQKITIDVKCAVGGYRDGDKIFLKNVGDTAELKAILHTYEFENGVEKDTIEASAVVTAAAETYANITWGYTFTNNTNTPAWGASTFKAVTSLPINDSLYAHYHFMAGTTDKSSKFKVTSADKSIVIVDDANTANIAAQIKGVKEGSTYLIVKDEKGNVVTTLPVTVSAARKATRLALSQVSLSLSRAANQEVVWVKAQVYDQYDALMDITEDVKVTPLTVANTADGNTVAVTSKSGTVYGVKVTAAGKTKGNYYYEVEAKTANGSVKNNLNVSIADPAASSSESFDIKLGAATVDLTQNATDGATSNKFQTIQVRRLNGGVLADYVDVASIASITIAGTNNEGTLPAVASNSATIMTVTCGAVSPSALAQVVKSGTYLVTVKMYTDAAKTASKVSTLTATFDVKNDTTARFGINIKETDANKSSKFAGTTTVDTIFNTAKANNDMIAYTFDGVEIDPSNVGTIVVNKKATGNSVYVESVEIEYTMATGVETYVVLPVKTTFIQK